MTFEEWHSTQEDRFPNYPVFREIWDVAVASEREACAKVCEELEIPPETLVGSSDKTIGWEGGTFDCADAIRARSEEK